MNQEDASPAQTPSHHLSLRPRRKVVGKLVTSRHSCLTLGSSFLPFWRCSPSLALSWSWLLYTFPRQAGHSSLHLPASAPWPSLPQPQAPLSSRSGPFPSHREAFKVATPCGLFSARCMESSKRNITYHPKTHVSPSEGGQIAFVCSRHAPLCPPTSLASHLTYARLAPPSVFIKIF